MATKKFTDPEIKHLELIQDVVTRMNSNSFQMKGWMVAIVSALLAIYADKQNEYFIIVAFVPTLLFWFLDTYYLWQERKFRGLYNDVAGITKNQKVALFAMRPDLYTGGKYSYWSVFGSVTILPLYLAVVAILASIYLFL